MWPNPQFSADLLTYFEKVLDGKLDFFMYLLKKSLMENLIFYAVKAVLKIAKFTKNTCGARVSF